MSTSAYERSPLTRGVCKERFDCTLNSGSLDNVHLKSVPDVIEYINYAVYFGKCEVEY